MAKALSAQSERTLIVLGERNIRSAIRALFTNAVTRIDIAAPDISGGQAVENRDLAETLAEAGARGIRPRLATEITKDNLPIVRIASELMQVRHVSGLKGAFAVSDLEYLSSPVVGDPVANLPVIYSNAHALVEQHQYIFETLWNRGEPSEERIEALETGIDAPQLETLRDPEKIRDLYLTMIKNAKNQILLLLPSQTAYERNERLGVFAAFEAAAARGVEVRFVCPPSRKILGRFSHSKGSLLASQTKIGFRPIPSAGSMEAVTVLVVDRTASLTIDERDSTKPDFGGSVGMATLVNRDPRVRSSIRFFERSWEESELRERERVARQREERSRRRAELMQDILTHDIRNFNQIARLNAELVEESRSSTERRKRTKAIIGAIDGSSSLIERANKIGRIMSERNVDLVPMSLKGSFIRSLKVVKNVNPRAKLSVSVALSGRVMADDFLDEVFTNIISNSVKYSDGNPVRIEATQDPVTFTESHRKPIEGWKISISDAGRGIPDEMKSQIFRRYLHTARGSGLGLSIVHALVTERYNGKVEIRNRVRGDHKKGTVVEVWLPRA